MDPIFIAYLAKLGIDTVSTIITSWQQSGSPTPDQIRQAFIVKRPEDYFNDPPQTQGQLQGVDVPSNPSAGLVSPVG